jgi:hypothetical protein
MVITTEKRLKTRKSLDQMNTEVIHSKQTTQSEGSFSFLFDSDVFPVA